MKPILLMPLLAATMMAADATGRWIGALTVPGEQSRPAHLVLKQDGSKLTGTAGPDEGQQHPIEDGKAEDGTITFNLPTGEVVMKFKLKHEGEEIKGDVTRERDGVLRPRVCW